VQYPLDFSPSRHEKGNVTTKDDIEHEEPIDICVRVVDELDRPSTKMAARLLVEDKAGNSFPFTVWNNNALSEYAWEEGRWYDLENARGNVYQGDESLNGSYDLAATPLDGVPERDDQKELFDTLSDGVPHLSLFPIEDDLGTLPVYEYRIEATGTFEQDPMDATYSLAAYLRNDSEAAVTHAGAMSVVATSQLSDDLPEPFSLAGERLIKLDTANEGDRAKLERLLQLDLKAAVDRNAFRADRIDRIVAKEPELSGAGGLFEACRAYGLRVEILPTGKVFVGVEVRLHARSQVTLDEYIERTNERLDDLVGTDVEHDPARYDISGSATFEGFSEKRFTDPLPDLGNQSLADWYEQKGRVSDGVLEALRTKNPQLVDIRYNPSDEDTRIHVPDLLRVAPRKEVVKRIAPEFHRQWDRAAKLLPEDRFTLATKFVESLGSLDEIGTKVKPIPVGPSRSFLSMKIDRSDNLVFGDGKTADLPKSGLSSYGVYKRPDSFSVNYLVPERHEAEFDQFRKGFERTLSKFDCAPEQTEITTYGYGTEVDYTETTVAVSETAPDAVLAVVPSQDRELIRDGTIDDPYDEFKKALGRQSIPSQMVVAENLDNQWVHRNTALGLIAGAGGVPWRVDDMPGSVDCFIGLDATYDPTAGQFLGASANVVLADGTVFVSKSQSLQSGETFDETAIVDIVKDVHREFVRREGDSPDHIVIHRDGRVFEDIDKILTPFEGAGIEIDILDIRKSGAPRAAYYDDGEFEIDEKGRLFIEQGGNYGFLTTTGRPEFDDSNGLGTPQALRIVRRAGETAMRTLLEQVYWLSESHVGSAQRSIRLPVSTYYADRCAEHAREGYLVNGELVEGLPYL